MRAFVKPGGMIQGMTDELGRAYLLARVAELELAVEQAKAETYRAVANELRMTIPKIAEARKECCCDDNSSMLSVMLPALTKAEAALYEGWANAFESRAIVIEARIAPSPGGEDAED